MKSLSIRILAVAVIVLAGCAGAPDVSEGRAAEGLLHAAEKGDAGRAASLIDSGVPVDAVDAERRTPLMRACAGGHVNVVELLIERGAGTERRDAEGMTPLLIAARHGQLDAVEVLIESGADPCTKDDSGRTALSIAAEEGFVRVVEFLCSERAGVTEIALPAAFSVLDDGACIHEPSGTLFPPAHGSYARLDASATVFDGEGRDVGIGYRATRPYRAELTSYVRSSDGESLASYFEASKAAVLKVNAGAVMGYEDADSDLKSAAFTYQRVFDSIMQPVLSCLFVGESNGWFIKVRVTFPVPQASLETKEQLADFLGNVPFFIPPRAIEG